MEEIVSRWLLVTGIFLVAEVIIRTYYMLGFASGGMAGAISASLMFPYWSQWVFFFFVAALFVAFTRIIKKSYVSVS